MRQPAGDGPVLDPGNPARPGLEVESGKIAGRQAATFRAQGPGNRIDTRAETVYGGIGGHRNRLHRAHRPEKAAAHTSAREAPIATVSPMP